MKNLSKILWGSVLVLVGIIVALNRLNVTNIQLFFSGWWTLFIIIPSLIGLFTDEEKIGNAIFFIVGILLLLSSQDLFDFNLVWKLVLPIAIVIVGLSLLFNGFEKSVEFPQDVKDKDIYATFSNEELNYSNKTFNGCNINSVFGSIVLDLSGSKIENDSVIKNSSIFGKTTIIIPKGVNIEIKKTSIFGAVTNNYNNKDSKKTLYIKSLCLFGGLEIKDGNTKEN